MADDALFRQLHAEAQALAPDFAGLRRLHTLMRACQVRTMPANGRSLECQASGLLIKGKADEGFLLVLDYDAPASEMTTCRSCSCTDAQACLTESGPCHWSQRYGDGTGLCSACDKTPQLFPISRP